MPISSINKALLGFDLRAEKATESKLIDTFVSAGALDSVLLSRDHRIIYGRRGTGKTHALRFVAHSAREKGDIPIFIDLRTIGSDTSVYSDSGRSIRERATLLAIDVLNHIHSELVNLVIDNSGELDLSILGPVLDDLSEAITRVRISGPVESISEQEKGKVNENTVEAAMKLSPRPTFDMKLGEKMNSTSNEKSSIKRVGSEHFHLHIGDVGRHLKRIAEYIENKNIYLLCDEWSSVPSELQPYLGDLIRRCLFPIQNITVQIVAIEQRSNFSIMKADRDYIGIEVGADASADINLDDLMVFDNDPGRARDFFSELVFRHYSANAESEHLHDKEELIRLAFTQVNVFDEFVRSVEGVPRDAMNILSIAARKANDQRISMEHVRAAARDWYSRDKANVLNSNPEMERLLRWIIEQVIGQRRARAFLILRDARSDLVDTLFDARLIHIAKRVISAPDQPGVRYIAFRLDYGCYVDLVTTAKAPLGLLPVGSNDDKNFLEVPPDDYRAIRRAILDLADFEKHTGK